MVQDCLECLELPGVHFSSPKLFEDTLEASVLNYCQYFNTDDYKRAGLDLAQRGGSEAAVGNMNF